MYAMVTPAPVISSIPKGHEPCSAGSYIFSSLRQNFDNFSESTIDANTTLAVTCASDVVQDSNRRNGIREPLIIISPANVSSTHFSSLFSCQDLWHGLFPSACNCFGRSDECVYDEDVFVNRLSLDIHGNYEGGGRCLNCRDHTEGVNCNKCVFGFYRPKGVRWNDTMPCKRKYQGFFWKKFLGEVAIFQHVHAIPASILRTAKKRPANATANRGSRVRIVTDVPKDTMIRQSARNVNVPWMEP